MVSFSFTWNNFFCILLLLYISMKLTHFFPLFFYTIWFWQSESFAFFFFCLYSETVVCWMNKWREYEIQFCCTLPGTKVWTLDGINTISEGREELSDYRASFFFFFFLILWSKFFLRYQKSYRLDHSTYTSVYWKKRFLLTVFFPGIILFFQW